MANLVNTGSTQSFFLFLFIFVKLFVDDDTMYLISTDLFLLTCHFFSPLLESQHMCIWRSRSPVLTKLLSYSLQYWFWPSHSLVVLLHQHPLSCELITALVKVTPFCSLGPFNFLRPLPQPTWHWHPQISSWSVIVFALFISISFELFAYIYMMTYISTDHVHHALLMLLA